MIHKKCLIVSACVVFSCTAMQQDSYRVPSDSSGECTSQALQSGTRVLRPTVNTTATQVSADEFFSTNDLAQRVAALSVVVTRATNGQALPDDFSVTSEHIKALRRGLCPKKDNDLVKGSSRRVLGAVDVVLSHAHESVLVGQQLFNNLSQPSSMSFDKKKQCLVAHVNKSEQLISALFESIDRSGTYYEDTPIVTPKNETAKYKLLLDPKGLWLVSIEALECFAKASDDNAGLCDSCKNCPQDMWCNQCQTSVSQHSRVTPFVRKLAQETEENVGVHDALRYLESRLGATGAAVETYMADGTAQTWQGSEYARSYAETRKALLQFAAVHKDVVEGIATMDDEDLSMDSVWPLLENAPSSIGLAAGAVKNKKSWNPLLFVPAQLFCSAVLGDKSTKKLDATVKDLPKGITLDVIAKMVQDGVKTTLGISDKELPLFCQLTHILSRPINGLIKEGVLCLRDSAIDVERFAAVYKKPMREQLLTSSCDKELAIMVHAWKSGGIATPQAMTGISVPVTEDYLDEEK